LKQSAAAGKVVVARRPAAAVSPVQRARLLPLQALEVYLSVQAAVAVVMAEVLEEVEELALVELLVAEIQILPEMLARAEQAALTLKVQVPAVRPQQP
jgi:hypothetical protein|tara:strand:+ start:136 stop:429 length:294 start_codon:yes stop_codon:yes gene_type:complete